MTPIESLPSPLVMSMSLSQSLGRRRSGRNFSAARLDPALLATVLWACAGQTDPEGLRTVPSAKDCREVLAYAVREDGVWRYDEKAHALVAVRAGDCRADTTTWQDFVARAPVTLVFAASSSRCAGLVASRAERCMSLDAGCMVQAAQLAAAALGLVSVARASFDEQRVAALLDPDTVPLIALTLGFAA